MNKNVVIGIVLVLLIAIAAVQAYQLMNIKNRLASGSMSGKAVQPAVKDAPPVQVQPSDTQDLSEGSC